MPVPSPPAGAAPEPAPVELTEFYCYECDSSVSLPQAAALPLAPRTPCPLCRGNFLEPGPPPPPPPPPPAPFLPGAEDAGDPFDFDEYDDLDELDGIDMMDPAQARLHIARFIQDRLYAVASPEDVAAATAAAMSLLDDHIAGGEPPAPAASIALLPTVEVSDPAAACAVCREDLPLASPALKLPCSHLYHSCCVVPWLEMHNTCPICRSRLPVPALTGTEEAPPPDRGARPSRITIRVTTTSSRRRARAANEVAMFAPAPISASPTQFAQAGTGEGGGGPANSGETVSSEWPSQPDSDTVMSEARDGDDFLDGGARGWSLTGEEYN